jgi:hypothetical protein
VSALPEPDPLLDAVQSALAGFLHYRAYCHPAKPGAVAVRSVYLDAAAAALEDAGLTVEREDGWLTVRDGRMGR